MANAVAENKRNCVRSKACFSDADIDWRKAWASGNPNRRTLFLAARSFVLVLFLIVALMDWYRYAFTQGARGYCYHGDASLVYGDAVYVDFSSITLTEDESTLQVLPEGEVDTTAAGYNASAAVTIVEAQAQSCFGLWFIYLTNWTFTAMVIYFALCVLGTHQAHALLAKEEEEKARAPDIEMEVVKRQEEEEEGAEEEKGGSKRTHPHMPWWIRLAWMLQEAVFAGSFMVTVLYWSLLYDPDKGTRFTGVFLHLIHFLIMFVDRMLTRQPCYPLHFWVTPLYATVYSLWSLLHYGANIGNGYGAGYIYSVLDWKDPGSTIAMDIPLILAAGLFSAMLQFCVALRRTAQPSITPDK